MGVGGTEGRDKHNNRPKREGVANKIGITALQIKHRDGHCCSYCGATERNEMKHGRNLELDHVIPKANGGTNDFHNLLTACKSCNSSRKKTALKDWIEKKRSEGKAVSIKGLTARLATPKCDPQAAKNSQAEVHMQFARDHDNQQGPDHAKAAKANRVAAEKLKAGGAFKGRAVVDARKATKKAWLTGKHGGQYTVATNGQREYLKPNMKQGT